MVALAVVLVLAAILFPVFAKARDSAKRSACISNIRQIGTALLFYANDHDDSYPRQDDCIVGGSLNPDLNQPGAVVGNGCTGPFPYRVNMYKWQAWILPYTENIGIYFCGSRRRDREHPQADCPPIRTAGDS